MKFKKYHIISFILLMCTLVIKEITELFYIINYNSNSLNVKYVYIINCFFIKRMFCAYYKRIITKVESCFNY